MLYTSSTMTKLMELYASLLENRIPGSEVVVTEIGEEYRITVNRGNMYFYTDFEDLSFDYLDEDGYALYRTINNIERKGGYGIQGRGQGNQTEQDIF